MCGLCREVVDDKTVYSQDVRLWVRCSMGRGEGVCCASELRIYDDSAPSESLFLGLSRGTARGERKEGEERESVYF